MKKEYIYPQTRVCNILLSALVCESVGFGGESDDFSEVKEDEDTDEIEIPDIWGGEW